MAATTWIPAAVPAAPAARPGGLRPPGGASLRVAPPVRRRRLVGLAAGLVLVAGLAGVGVRAAAAPEAPPVGGHVVLAPGETLWDVAVRTAAPGVDPRAQLRDLVLLNDLDPAVAPEAWTVVLLPGR